MDFIPRPLNMQSRSVKLSINGVAITVSRTSNLEVSNMINILFEKKAMYTNLARMTMGWLDVPGKISYLQSVTTNDHANKQQTSVVNADPRFIADKMIVLMFYNSDQYVTSSQSILFKWNKSSNRRILTGSQHGTSIRCLQTGTFRKTRQCAKKTQRFLHAPEIRDAKKGPGNSRQTFRARWWRHTGIRQPNTSRNSTAQQIRPN